MADTVNSRFTANQQTLLPFTARISTTNKIATVYTARVFTATAVSRYRLPPKNVLPSSWVPPEYIILPFSISGGNIVGSGRKESRSIGKERLSGTVRYSSGTGGGATLRSIRTVAIMLY